MRKIQDQVNLKADRTELEELEKLLMIRFNDIITALTLKFADKAETKKALKLLERQLKNLYDPSHTAIPSPSQIAKTI
jgi:hypothetical protein